MNRKQNTDYYEFKNVNPHNKITGDCVIRAIANATDQPWLVVYDALVDIGRKYGYMPNDDKCFHKYLKDLGWVKMPEPRDVNNRKYSVKEWITRYPSDRNIIANVGSHHTSCIINNKIEDIWNCSFETLHSYWVKL